MGAAKPSPRARRDRELRFPALFHYRAAEGWLELGNLREAERELSRIPARARTHLKVLLLRWQIDVRAEQWDRCLTVAKTLTQRYPDDPRTWIVYAETFYYLGNVQKAFCIAATQAERFPDSWNLLYDAACYACLIGKFNDAQFFFQRAMLADHAQSKRQTSLESSYADTPADTPRLALEDESRRSRDRLGGRD